MNISSDRNIEKLRELRNHFKAGEITDAIYFASVNFNAETSDIILPLMGFRKIFRHRGERVYEDVNKMLLKCSLESRQTLFRKAFSYRALSDKYYTVANEILFELGLDYRPNKKVQEKIAKHHVVSILDYKYGIVVPTSGTSAKSLVEDSLNEGNYDTAFSTAFVKAATK
jgi:hypothetical protein